MSESAKIVEQIFREESGRVLGALINTLGDFDLAEDAFQETLIAALEHWPVDGVPNNPAAWLTTVARRKAIDRLRRAKVGARKQALLIELLHTEQADEEPDVDVHPIPDERLKLMFTCCRPSLATSSYPPPF